MYFITVPKGPAAMVALNYDQATPDQLLEIVLTDSQFEALWRSKVFALINKIAHVNIDMAEDEAITDMLIMQKVLSSDIFLQDFGSGDVNRLVQEIKFLFEQALGFGTGVFFYF